MHAAVVDEFEGIIYEVAVYLMSNFICPIQDNGGHRKLARLDADKENRKDVPQSIKGAQGSIPLSEKTSSRSKAMTPPKAGVLGGSVGEVEELSVFEEIMNEVGTVPSWMDDDSDGDDIQL